MNLLKEHPYILVGAIGVVILAVVLRGSGGGAQASVDSTNLGLANLSTSLQAAQTSANENLDVAALHYLSNVDNNRTALALKTTEVNGAIAANRDTVAGNVALAPALATIAGNNNIALAEIGQSTAAQTANALAQASMLRSLVGPSGIGGILSGIGSGLGGAARALGAGGTTAATGSSYLQDLNAGNAAQYGSLAGYAY